MNIKEFCLDEIELHVSTLDEGVACLLHTILFVRAPGKFRPVDHNCQSFPPFCFAKCGQADVEDSVNVAIQSLKESLVEVGPNVSRGLLVLSFYVMREHKTLFGFISNQEKSTFERWKIPIIVDEKQFSPAKKSSTLGSVNLVDETGEFARNRIIDTAKSHVTERMMTIFEYVNTACEHIPDALYEYEIEVSSEQKVHSMTTKLISSSPGLINSLS